MRYERLSEIIRLAMRLQGADGLSLDDIQSEFSVSRRTAERMRDAVEFAFEPLEFVDGHDGKKHWRLRSNNLRDLVFLSADELVELETAATGLERAGLDERAGLLRGLAAKLRALLGPAERRRLEPDLEALTMAEGLAMRPGPRPRMEPGLLKSLRDAIMGGRVIAFRYLSRTSGRRSRQQVQPHGLLYGNRAYLIGRADWTDGMRYWVLANMSDVTVTDEMFEFDGDFDFSEFAGRSFGVFQEEPFDVTLHFASHVAPDVASFRFHPGQELKENEDGSMTVKFRAGGSVEMCRHIFTWGESVTIEEPAHLRGQLADMCAALSEHHRARPVHGRSPVVPDPEHLGKILKRRLSRQPPRNL